MCSLQVRRNSNEDIESFGSGSPLIIQEGEYHHGAIAVFIDKRIIQDIPAHEERCHLVARRVLQGASVVAGFAGRIPFIGINLQLGGSNKVYGGFLAYGTCASFGYLVSYSLLEIVDAQMGPLTREEQILTESRMSPCLKKTFLVAATALGVITQVPFAYVAYKYNEPSTLNPDGLLMPIMVIAIDSWVSTYSGYMGMKALRERQGLTDYQQGLAAVRGKMCGLIEANRELLTLVGQDERLDFVASYERIRRIEEAPDRVNALYDLFTRRITDQTLEPSDCAKRIDAVVKTYGYLCALCNIGTLGYIAWLGTNELDSTALDVTVTALYVGTALYLNTTAIPSTAVVLFNLFKSLFTCSYKPTLSDQLSPKLSFTLKSLGLATAALSYGPSIKLSEDYYGPVNEGLEVFMEVTLTCATTFLVSMAILAITDQLLEKSIENLGSEDERKVIHIYKQMRLFSTTLASSPLIEVARHLKVLPKEVVDDLIADTEITLSNLEEFIRDHASEKGRLLELEY